MPKQTVVFDVGGVLVPHANRLERIESFIRASTGLFDASGLDVAALACGYWEHRDEYDLGLPVEDYWSRVLAGAAVGFEHSALQAVAEFDGSECAAIGAPELELIRHLETTGCRLGILSNAPRPMAREIRASAWFGHFDFAVFSCDIGHAKPHEQSYRAVEAHTAAGQEPRPIIFFDDRPANVEAAAGLGWSGLRWESAPIASGYLARQG